MISSIGLIVDVIQLVLTAFIAYMIITRKVTLDDVMGF